MKNIYITWHYTTHGVAYLKHILSKFYKLGSIPDKNLVLDNLDQVELNEVFSQPKKDGFLFDEVIYLTAPQCAFDRLSNRRFSYKQSILEDDIVKEKELSNIFSNIINDDDICYNLKKEIEFVGEKYPEKLQDFKQVIWRNIQHYPIVEQLYWLKEHSNFKSVYEARFSLVELPVADLRSEKEIADAVSNWIGRYFSTRKDVLPIINVSLGSNETQVVWHILAQAERLPTNTRFVKTYDDKSDSSNMRFKHFSIQEIPVNLVSSLRNEFRIFTETKSPQRAMVQGKMRTLLKSGFSILLLGERGIGKSRIASEANQSKTSNIPFIEANCASFDQDSKAEAELFGYEMAAFTGANKAKKGLLEEADNGILFLDEIHHLSKLVQAKLMKALQTDDDNKMSIRKMGSSRETKVECRLIFASNQRVSELRESLLPDFYDRIVQHVVEIPPLRNTIEDRQKDWGEIWENLKFEMKPKVPIEGELMIWLNSLPLYGNYRDLQKIAIYYNAFCQFDQETLKYLNEKSPFQYARNEFEKYHSPVVQSYNEAFNFNINQTTKAMIADYLFNLQDWAVDKFKGRKSAIEHFGAKGDSVTEKTFNDWKNKKSLKKG